MTHRRDRWLWSAVIGGAVCAASCDTGAPKVAKTRVIRMCGSSTMGARLAPRLVAQWLDRDAPLAELHHAIQPKGWCLTGQAFGGRDEVTVCVDYRGSHDAERLVANGECDIGMFSGPWRNKAGSPIKAVTVGRDAIMIVTAHDSSLSSVSISQLARWYGGGRPPEGLRVIQRDEETSGTSSALASRLGFEGLRTASWNRIPADSFGELIAAGGQWLYYVSAQEQLSASGFRVLGVRPNEDREPVLPSLDVLAADRYPLGRELSLLIKTNEVSTLVGGFVAWMQTSQARPIFESMSMWHATSGSIDRAQVSVACANNGAPVWVHGRRVASVYFGRRRRRVPSKSWAAGYLTASVKIAAQRDRDLVIIGYSSLVGDRDKNCELAQARAENVRSVANEAKRRLGIESDQGPKIRVLVGGPTRFWGDKPRNNRVVTIFAIEPDAR